MFNYFYQIDFLYVFKIIAEYQGGFLASSFFPSFKTKYLLIPDPRIRLSGWAVASADVADGQKRALEQEEYKVIH